MTRTPRMNTMDHAIGETVRARREASQLQLSEAARVMGMSEFEYEACELGQQPFEAGHLFKLANFFGCRVRDLMPAEDGLRQMDYDVRYGDAEEVRDLIFYFSGVVSPSLRSFFLKQLEDASVQGERLEMPQPVKEVPVKVKPKRIKPFAFLFAN